MITRNRGLSPIAPGCLVGGEGEGEVMATIPVGS
jgi:hypothetical protein